MNEGKRDQLAIRYSTLEIRTIPLPSRIRPFAPPVYRVTEHTVNSVLTTGPKAITDDLVPDSASTSLGAMSERTGCGLIYLQGWVCGCVWLSRYKPNDCPHARPS